MMSFFRERSARLYARALQRPLLAAALFAGVLAPLLVFAAIAEDVHEGDGLHWDTPLLHFVHGFASPQMDSLVIAVTNLGSARVMVPFCGFVVLGMVLARQLRNGRFFAVATGGAGVLNLLTKAIFGRARPDLWVSPAPELDYGFPSGHSMISMAVALACFFIAWPTKLRWPVAVVGALFTVAIGLTRLYLGVHYPSDVIGGWCASLVWVTGLHFIDRGLSRSVTPSRRASRQDLN